MTPQEEKSIIQRVVGGEKNAFEELVLANQKNVYNLALKMLRNEEDALDISQEAFIKAYRNLSGFRFDSRFSVWLYKLTYNLCIDAIRKERSLRSNLGANPLSLDFEDDSGDALPVEIPDVRNLPEDNVLRRELRSSIVDGINELSLKHREILVMREITDMGYEEISVVLGISCGTVKSRLSRARLSLAQLLENKGTIPDCYRLKLRGEVAEQDG